MPDKREKLLRIVCIVLGGVVALQLALFAVHASFSRGLTVPALPLLPPEMEAQAGKGTNTLAATNSSKLATNAPAKVQGTTNATGTNLPAARSQVSNSPPGPGVTNGGHSKTASTGTNSLPEAVKQEIAGAASSRPGTNASNVVAVVDKTLTNSSASKSISKKGFSPGGRSGAQSKIADLPAPIKERIDRITQGEILAPVMRPLPMALLGIAGQSAFLRGPDGQTGLVKEGDQLGTLKLLRIGTNRVLIEQDGEKKELMIFAGLGSESLLPKPDKTTNEPAKKSP